MGELTPFFDFLLRALKVKIFPFSIYRNLFTILNNFYLPGRKYRANLGCPVFLF